jgi:hypothetical protein
VRGGFSVIKDYSAQVPVFLLTAEKSKEIDEQK